MKIKLFILCSLLIVLCSCKGSSGKKAWEAGKRAVEEYHPRIKNPQRTIDNVEKVYDKITEAPCGYCNGSGRVPAVNEYGYYITDAYGNVQHVYCPACSGTGKQ